MAVKTNSVALRARTQDKEYSDWRIKQKGGERQKAT